MDDKWFDFVCQDICEIALVIPQSGVIGLARNPLASNLKDICYSDPTATNSSMPRVAHLISSAGSLDQTKFKARS